MIPGIYIAIANANSLEWINLVDGYVQNLTTDGRFKTMIGKLLDKQNLLSYTLN